MKIILDESVPRQLVSYLRVHEVTTVPQAGWASVKNGKLLGFIERTRFDAFITADKNLEAQQPIARRPFAILLLSTNHWKSMKPHVGLIAAALDTARPGSVTKVECGAFMPRQTGKSPSL